MKVAASMLFILAALPSVAVWAQADAEPAPSQFSLVGQLAQLGGGLLLVVGLIFLMGYVMRRVGPLAPQGGQHIRLVSSLPLGPRDRLLLVDVGGQQLLLGASPGRINTLHVFEEPVAEITASGAMPSEFARTLRGLLKREPKA